MRSSILMYGAPPLVRFITASVDCLIRGRNAANAARLWSGLPVSGLRACRWTIAAPALAAPIEASAIWSGVTVREGDIDGVWMAPVIAHEMMIFWVLAMLLRLELR